MSRLEIRVKVGYEDGGINVDDKLDFDNEWDLLSYYPVTIELVKCEGISSDDEDYKEEVIAAIEGLYFDIEYMTNENVSFFEVFDNYDQSVYELYNVLFDGDNYKEEYDVFNPNLFYLMHINVLECYQDYKEMLLNKLDEILKYIAKLNVGLIATEAWIVADVMDDNVSDVSKSEAKEMLFNNGYITNDDDEEYWVKQIF